MAATKLSVFVKNVEARKKEMEAKAAGTQAAKSVMDSVYTIDASEDENEDDEDYVHNEADDDGGTHDDEYTDSDCGSGSSYDHGYGGADSDGGGDSDSDSDSDGDSDGDGDGDSDEQARVGAAARAKASAELNSTASNKLAGEIEPGAKKLRLRVPHRVKTGCKLNALPYMRKFLKNIRGQILAGEPRTYPRFVRAAQVDRRPPAVRLRAPQGDPQEGRQGPRPLLLEDRGGGPAAWACIDGWLRPLARNEAAWGQAGPNHEPRGGCAGHFDGRDPGQGQPYRLAGAHRQRQPRGNAVRLDALESLVLLRFPLSKADFLSEGYGLHALQGAHKSCYAEPSPVPRRPRLQSTVRLDHALALRGAGNSGQPCAGPARRHSLAFSQGSRSTPGIWRPCAASGLFFTRRAAVFTEMRARQARSIAPPSARVCWKQHDTPHSLIQRLGTVQLARCGARGLSAPTPQPPNPQPPPFFLTVGHSDAPEKPDRSRRGAPRRVALKPLNTGGVGYG